MMKRKGEGTIQKGRRRTRRKRRMKKKEIDKRDLIVLL